MGLGGGSIASGWSQRREGVGSLGHIPRLADAILKPFLLSLPEGVVQSRLSQIYREVTTLLSLSWSNHA